MNKKLILLITLIGTFIIILWLYIGALGFVKHFSQKEQTQLEAVLESDSLQNLYGLGMKKSPLDYGFSNVKELQFLSIIDNTKLCGWFITPDSVVSSQCLILAHSASKNRLEMLKFLEIIKENNLLKKYSIFIPDLRNAGNSEASSIYMGFKMSEDIASAMMLLKQKYQINDFVLYGVAEGAMASVLAVRRRELLYRLQYDNITVDKLILDSPISAAKETLERQGDEFSFLDKKLGIWLFDQKVGGYLDKMDLSQLLTNSSKDFLILQNIGDEISPTDILLSKLPDQPNIGIQLFDGDEHSGMATDPYYKEQYARLVADFLAQ